MANPGLTFLGLGTDLVEIERFRLAMQRRASLPERLFSDDERAYAFRHRDPAPRLAVRFGAKEAVMKALGVGLGAFKLRDVEVVRLRSGAPEIALYGKAAELAEARGVTTWHLSLTHSDIMAMAVAVALGLTVLPVLTPAEMADADRRTIAAGTPVEVLMERAGRAVAWAVRRELLGCSGKRVVAVCGKGNNGGDGLVAARVLRGWGARVDVFGLEHGIDRQLCERSLRRADAVVDAMYGTGFRGALKGDAAWAARAMEAVLGPCVAVDVPSGVDGATGATRGDTVHASHTVCLAALKPGLLFAPGSGHAGEIAIADIGIDLGVDPLHPPRGVLEDVDVELALPERDEAAHKWQSGVLVVGGSGGMVGAPLMASRAAMRAGAGIVWCALPGHDAAARASGTEVITHALPATADGALDDAAAAAVLEVAARFRAVVVGPGLGRDERTAAAVRRIVAEVPVALVLDADGLNALDGDLAPLRARTAPTVLTPHAKEYERLLGEPVGDDRLAAADRLATASGAVTLLKGPGTIVASPAGAPVAINPTGGPALASAGTGDVLSGIVGALVARGGEPWWAAAAAAFVHGRAAETAGHTGLIAGDLIDALPRVLDELEP